MHVIVGLKIFNVFNIKVFKSIWRQVLGNEFRKIEQTSLDVCDGVTGNGYNSLVIPDVGVEVIQSFFAHFLEEIGFSVLLVIFFVDVD